MKHGFNNTPANEFPYWVLPDKPMENMQTSTDQSATVFKGGWQSWDVGATQQQTKQICKYLSGACVGRWLERGHRFYFESEDDYEMFKTMCSIGWQ